MQLNDILNDAEDQERGRWFDLADPVDGKPTGIRLKIVGPDSATQAKSRLRMVDELAEICGPITAEWREKVRLNMLARCVTGWEIKEDGNSLRFSHEGVLRLLRAAQWVQQQVDGFASDRAAFREARDE